MSVTLESSGRLVKLSKGNDVISAPRALWVGTAGTANITDMQGTAHQDFPLLQGLNPIRITKLASGGEADDIWALY
jgi:hypothetical protein